MVWLGGFNSTGLSIRRYFYRNHSLFPCLLIKSEALAVINVHKISKQAATNTTKGKKGCYGFLNKDVTDLLKGKENRKSRKKDYNPTGFADFTFFFSSTFTPLEHGMDARDASNCPSII